MSKKGEAYFAEQMAADQAEASRKARVREFVAENDPEIISDLFTVIKDAVIENGVRKSAAIMEQHKIATAAVFEVECEFMGLM